MIPIKAHQVGTEPNVRPTEAEQMWWHIERMITVSVVAWALILSWGSMFWRLMK